METLLKEINKLLESKNTEIHLLKWENDQHKEEIGMLKQEIAELKKDIEKYEENEVNRA